MRRLHLLIGGDQFLEELIAAVDNSGAPTLTVDGYSVWLMAYEQMIPLPNEELNGVKVLEHVARFRDIVEET